MTPDEVAITFYVVYERPRDYPENYVVRRQVVLATGKIAVDKNPWAIGMSLEEVRSAIPAGLYRLARDPEEDEQQLVESWV